MLSMRIKNMEYSFPEVWQSILDLDYPKKHLDVYIIENDSTIDNTKQVLNETFKKYKRKFRSFNIEYLELDQKHIKYWDLHRGQEDFWVHASNFIRIHNKRFYPKAWLLGDKYFFSMQADTVIDPATLKEYLKVYESWPEKISWVSGHLNRRKSGDGEPAVYIIKPRRVDKPWRIMPKAEGLSMSIWFPYRITDLPKAPTIGLISYGVTLQPTELCIKYPLSYNIGDVVLSYISQAREHGFTEVFLPGVKHTHIDRDGTRT